jgi:gamma-glutamyl-gamma-aminobutyrate hydrolase PuuD
MQPFIGVTCSSDPQGCPRVNPNYVHAVHAAGGLPVPLPWILSADEADDVLGRLHGVLFTGSEDLDPSLWGEVKHPKTTFMHPHRMTTEIEMSQAILRRPLPVLAVCGGMQTINVVAGGSLHQHIPDIDDELLEHIDPELERRHGVEALAESLIGEVCGPAFETNTGHHQAINRLGSGLTATAWCTDGLVEAFEGANEVFLVGVQWHPERLLDDPGQAALFTSLTAAARTG